MKTNEQFTNEELRHEEWRRCQYPFVRYEVSNLGRVRHALRKMVLKLSDNRYGYLGMRTRQGFLYPHKQVALVFCPGWREGLQVNHKDGNKYNNRATNLEWVTASENIRHGYYVLGQKVKPVGLFDEQHHLQWLFPSARECNRRLGSDVKRDINRGNRYHGYEPRYLSWKMYKRILLIQSLLDCTIHAAYVEACLEPTPSLPSVANGGFAPLGGAAATPVAALKTPVARREWESK